MALPIAALAAVLGGGALASSILSIPPIQRGQSQFFNEIFPNEIPSPAELIEMRWRRIITDETFTALMKKNGINEETANQLFTASQNLLTPFDVITAKRRGAIDDETYNTLMRRNRTTAEQRKIIETVSEFKPQVQDIIRFAVREAFSPDFVERFKLDEDFPEVVSKRAAELGMSEEDAKLFWRSHWELPSVSMATEMFHRLNPEWEKEHPVAREDFQQFLKAADISPYWRPRVEKVLYSPMTRVDVRRMRKFNLISEEQAIQFYRELGYTEEHAKLLADFAVMESREEDRELTRSMVMEAFNAGQLDENATLNHLKGMGYAEEDAALIVNIEKAQRDAKELKASINLLQDAFEKGTIDEAALSAGMDELGLSAEQRDKAILEAMVGKSKKKTVPSKADVEEFLKKGIINMGQAELMLADAGVRAGDIPLYLQSWSVK